MPAPFFFISEKHCQNRRREAWCCMDSSRPLICYKDHPLPFHTEWYVPVCYNRSSLKGLTAKDSSEWINHDINLLYNQKLHHLMTMALGFFSLYSGETREKKSGYKVIIKWRYNWREMSQQVNKHHHNSAGQIRRSGHLTVSFIPQAVLWGSTNRMSLGTNTQESWFILAVNNIFLSRGCLRTLGHSVGWWGQTISGIVMNPQETCCSYFKKFGKKRLSKF